MISLLSAWQCWRICWCKYFARSVRFQPSQASLADDQMPGSNTLLITVTGHVSFINMSFECVSKLLKASFCRSCPYDLRLQIGTYTAHIFFWPHNYHITALAAPYFQERCVCCCSSSLDIFSIHMLLGSSKWQVSWSGPLALGQQAGEVHWCHHSCRQCIPGQSTLMCVLRGSDSMLILIDIRLNLF